MWKMAMTQWKIKEFYSYYTEVYQNFIFLPKIKLSPEILKIAKKFKNNFNVQFAYTVQVVEIFRTCKY